MTRFVLYGIAGASGGYRVVQYDFYDGAIYDIKPVKVHAGMMRMNNPAIERVYMVKADTEIKHDYMKTIKRNSIEANVIFRTTLEQYGLLIP